MSRLSDLEWDALRPLSPPALLAAKRGIEAAERQVVGQEDPDWKLRVVMLREAREDADSERRRAYCNRPDVRATRSRVLRESWQAGKFATRKQAYLKRTDRLVARALRARARGWTYAQIADALKVTVYTAWRWCGAERKPDPTNRLPVVVRGVAYPSLREAERQTGVARSVLRKTLGRSPVLG